MVFNNLYCHFSKFFFLVVCLFPLHSFGLVNFDHGPSSAACFYVFSFGLIEGLNWSFSTLATWCEELIHWKKSPDTGKDWGQGEGMTEDEMVGWHHWLDRHEFEQAPGVGDGQRSPACCFRWGCKELDMTELDCTWGLYSAGCKVRVSLTYGICPWWVVLDQCLFLGRGWMVPIFWWVELDLVLLKGIVVPNVVLWYICDFGMTLGKLSVNV